MENNITIYCMNHSKQEIEFQFQGVPSLVAGAAATLISLLGMVLNGVTIAALLNHTPIRRHVTTPFVISLAFSDLLFSVTVLPVMAVRFFTEDWIEGKQSPGFLCKLFPLIFYGITAATLFNILAVTMNRWAMVYFPNKSESIFTRRKSKLYIFACWMLPLLVMTPSLTGAWGNHKLHCKSRSCTIIDDDENVKLKFKTFIMTLGVFFPTLMLIIFNIMIYARVRRMTRSLAGQMEGLRTREDSSSSNVPKSLKNREKQITKMMAIIFATFLMTYIPGYLVKQIDKEHNYPLTHVIFYIINWVAVLINPLIYVATNKTYKKAICLLFKKCFKTKQEYHVELRPTLRTQKSLTSQTTSRVKF